MLEFAFNWLAAGIIINCLLMLHDTVFNKLKRPFVFVFAAITWPLTLFVIAQAIWQAVTNG